MHKSVRNPRESFKVTVLFTARFCFTYTNSSFQNSVFCFDKTFVFYVVFYCLFLFYEKRKRSLKNFWNHLDSLLRVNKYFFGPVNGCLEFLCLQTEVAMFNVNCHLLLVWLQHKTSAFQRCVVDILQFAVKYWLEQFNKDEEWKYLWPSKKIIFTWKK